MARLVIGDREVFNQMVFGPPDPYFQQYLQQTNNYFSNMLTDVGRNFIQHAENVFARTDVEEAMAIAKAALRATNIYFQNDIIYTMSTIEEVQEAPDTMLRWIMCHPDLQRMYQENMIDGYNERYVPHYVNVGYGWNNPDYQVIYNGWMNPVIEKTIDNEGNEVEEEYVECVQVLMEENDPDIPILLDEETHSIIVAHHLVDIALSQNRDPTSYYDNRL